MAATSLGQGAMSLIQSLTPAAGRSYIQQRAGALGLDPNAVLAVAGQEGLSGAIGDQGTSFGPFQLHWGGAMPSRFVGNQQASNAWAWSQPGIDYALSQMNAARGLQGQAAVSSIVRNFERPADPSGEAARAWAAYGKQGATPSVPLPQSGKLPMVMGPPQFSQSLYHQNMLNAFALGGGRIDLTQLPQMQQASYVQSPLKQLPTGLVQSQGVVSPGGHLQDPPSAQVNPLIHAASTQIGKPYVFGSESPGKSFDCSGLVLWAYKQVGINIPRTTFQQVKVGQNVTGQPMQPGDLLFYAGSDGTASNPGHVVMYVGNGQVIAAPHTGTVVQYQPLQNLGKPVAVRRILP